MCVRTERRGPAAWITLDRPERRNALSPELIAGLDAAVRASHADDAVRALVLTGAGPSFCAGADLAGFAFAENERHPLGALLELLWTGPKPVVAAVNGHAFGGGAGLVAACDVAIAAETAELGFPEVRLGVAPAIVAVVVVPKLGPAVAGRLFVTGERFGAEEALRYGLVHRVVPATELEAAAAAEAEAIAHGGPEAVAEAKRLARELGGLPSAEAFARAEATSRRLFASDEAAEGFAAFVEKRPPRWAG